MRAEGRNSPPVTKVPLDVWFFGSRHNVSSLSLISAFSVCVCPDAFLVDITLPTFSPQSLEQILWDIFVASARGFRNSCFIGRRHTQLTAALMWCANLSKL